MTCRHCGAELASGSLFCGDCGRAVRMDPAARDGGAAPTGSADGEPAWVPDLLATRREIVFPITTRADPEAEGPVPAAPADADDAGAGRALAEEVVADDADVGDADVGDADADADRSGSAEPELPIDDVEGELMPDGVPSAGESPDEPADQPAEEPTERPDDPTPPAPPIVPVPGSVALDAVSDPDRRFTLQFSTGEIVSVLGTGLIGRKPVPQPGEYVDQLVDLVDAGKSVSKTHLEFGGDDGGFWVADRFSTNGTVLRAADDPPRRCDPGKRYRVERGSRVDLGEQFFVLG